MVNTLVITGQGGFGGEKGGGHTPLVVDARLPGAVTTADAVRAAVRAVLVHQLELAAWRRVDADAHRAKLCNERVLAAHLAAGVDGAEASLRHERLGQRRAQHVRVEAVEQPRVRIVPVRLLSAVAPANQMKWRRPSVSIRMRACRPRCESELSVQHN